MLSEIVYSLNRQKWLTLFSVFSKLIKNNSIIIIRKDFFIYTNFKILVQEIPEKNTDKKDKCQLN